MNNELFTSICNGDIQNSLLVATKLVFLHETPELLENVYSVDDEINYLYKVKESALNKYDEHIIGLTSFNKSHLIKHGVKKQDIVIERVSEPTIIKTTSVIHGDVEIVREIGPAVISLSGGEDHTIEFNRNDTAEKSLSGEVIADGIFRAIQNL